MALLCTGNDIAIPCSPVRSVTPTDEVRDARAGYVTVYQVLDRLLHINFITQEELYSLSGHRILNRDYAQHFRGTLGQSPGRPNANTTLADPIHAVPFVQQWIVNNRPIASAPTGYRILQRENAQLLADLERERALRRQDVEREQALRRQDEDYHRRRILEMQQLIADLVDQTTQNDDDNVEAVVGDQHWSNLKELTKEEEK